MEINGNDVMYTSFVGNVQNGNIVISSTRCRVTSAEVLEKERKIKYLRDQFKDVDSMTLHDTLSASDFDIQKAVEKLLETTGPKDVTPYADWREKTPENVSVNIPIPEVKEENHLPTENGFHENSSSSKSRTPSVEKQPRRPRLARSASNRTAKKESKEKKEENESKKTEKSNVKNEDSDEEDDELSDLDDSDSNADDQDKKDEIGIINEEKIINEQVTDIEDNVDENIENSDIDDPMPVDEAMDSESSDAENAESVGENEEAESINEIIGDRNQIVEFFQNAPEENLKLLFPSSKKSIAAVLESRPFKSWINLVQKLQDHKDLNIDALDRVRLLLKVHSNIKTLLEKFLTLTKQVENAIAAKTNITNQPKILSPKVKLTGHQLIGLNWLKVVHQQKTNAVLADEKGFGKEIQLIAFFAHLKEIGVTRPGVPHLVVVPSKFIAAWQVEFGRICSSLKVLYYNGSEEERKHYRDIIYKGDISDYDVILATYSSVNSPEEIKMFRIMQVHYAAFVDDDNFKDLTSETYENLMKIKALKKLLLVDSIEENNFLELMSLLNFINPSVFSESIEEIKNFFSDIWTGSENLSTFEAEHIKLIKKNLKPFVMRRLEEHLSEKESLEKDIIKEIKRNNLPAIPAFIQLTQEPHVYLPYLTEEQEQMLSSGKNKRKRKSDSESDNSASDFEEDWFSPGDDITDDSDWSEDTEKPKKAFKRISKASIEKSSDTISKNVLQNLDKEIESCWSDGVTKENESKRKSVDAARNVAKRGRSGPLSSRSSLGKSVEDNKEMEGNSSKAVQRSGFRSVARRGRGGLGSSTSRTVELQMEKDDPSAKRPETIENFLELLENMKKDALANNRIPQIKEYMQKIQKPEAADKETTRSKKRRFSPIDEDSFNEESGTDSDYSIPKTKRRGRQKKAKQAVGITNQPRQTRKSGKRILEKQVTDESNTQLESSKQIEEIAPEIKKRSRKKAKTGEAVQGMEDSATKKVLRVQPTIINKPTNPLQEKSTVKSVLGGEKRPLGNQSPIYTLVKKRRGRPTRPKKDDIAQSPNTDLSYQELSFDDPEVADPLSIPAMDINAQISLTEQSENIKGNTDGRYSDVCVIEESSSSLSGSIKIKDEAKPEKSLIYPKMEQTVEECKQELDYFEGFPDSKMITDEFLTDVKPPREISLSNEIEIKEEEPEPRESMQLEQMSMKQIEEMQRESDMSKKLEHLQRELQMYKNKVAEMEKGSEIDNKQLHSSVTEDLTDSKNRNVKSEPPAASISSNTLDKLLKGDQSISKKATMSHELEEMFNIPDPKEKVLKQSNLMDFCNDKNKRKTSSKAKEVETIVLDDDDDDVEEQSSSMDVDSNNKEILLMQVNTDEKQQPNLGGNSETRTDCDDEKNDLDSASNIADHEPSEVSKSLNVEKTLPVTASDDKNITCSESLSEIDKEAEKMSPSLDETNKQLPNSDEILPENICPKNSFSVQEKNDSPVASTNDDDISPENICPKDSLTVEEKTDSSAALTNDDDLSPENVCPKNSVSEEKTDSQTALTNDELSPENVCPKNSLSVEEKTDSQTASTNDEGVAPENAEPKNSSSLIEKTDFPEEVSPESICPNVEEETDSPTVSTKTVSNNEKDTEDKTQKGQDLHAQGIMTTSLSNFEKFESTEGEENSSSKVVLNSKEYPCINLPVDPSSISRMCGVQERCFDINRSEEHSSWHSSTGIRDQFMYVGVQKNSAECSLLSGSFENSINFVNQSDNDLPSRKSVLVQNLPEGNIDKEDDFNKHQHNYFFGLRKEDQ